MERTVVFQACERFRSKLQNLLFLEISLWALSFWFFIGGTVILIVRSVMALANPSMAWVIPGCVGALAFAAWQSRCRLPSDSILLALLDEQNRSGGLVMATGEKTLGSWENEVASLKEPPIFWKGRKTILVFVSALSYLILGFALPQQMVKSIVSKHLDLQAESERLQDKIDTLKNEDMIDATQAEKMEEKLSALLNEATSDDPAKTYEALDHLEEMLAKVTNKALEKALDQNQKLSKAGSLAEGMLNDPASSAFHSGLETLNENIAGMDDSTDSASLPSGFNDPDMVTPLDGDATPEQIKELLDKLNKQQLRLDAKLIKLGKVGLIDKKTFDALKKKAKPGEKGDPDSGLIVLGDDEESSAGEAGEAIMLDVPGAEGKPGKGGISKGRGDAPLRYNGKTDENGVGFKEEALPSAKASALQGSQQIGVGMSAPSLETQLETPSGGNFSGDGKGTAAAYSHRILPQHQATVKRYFQRNEGGN